MADEQTRAPTARRPARRTGKDDRTLHDVAREAFEKRVAAGDGLRPEPMSDVDRLS